LLLAVSPADHIRIALQVATTRRLEKGTERGIGREGDKREEGRKGHTATAKCEGHHLGNIHTKMHSMTWGSICLSGAISGV
jgi:hypothetical protein